MSSFERFENKWTITGIISLDTPLRIGIGGRGAEYSIASSPVLMRYDARLCRYLPFIPGSSLKGVIRTLSERITRTLGYNVCNAVLENKNDKISCGRCEVCKIFGGGTDNGQGAKIRVRDAVLCSEYKIMYKFTEEMPHYADQYNKERDKYVINVNKNGYRTEDEISQVSFDLRIELDNASEWDVDLIRLALDEFNHKRAHIGGGASRGNGFVSVDKIRVEKIEIQPDAEKIFAFKRNVIIEDEINRLKTLVQPKHPKNIERTGFDVYACAGDKTPNGCIVCEFEVETTTDFRMPGVEEVTVTVSGVPVIPGSTIKGSLKKHFIKKWDVGIIDDIFGSVNPKGGHRSRVLVSNAFNSISTTDMIPKGAKLKCWIVFDNMDENMIRKIISALSESHKITGETSSKAINNGNWVKFSLKKAWKFCIDDFEYDVTSQLEAA